MNQKFFLALMALSVVYIIGWFLPVMDIDAAQYASMSREMLQRNDFLHLYDLGQPYLDKPPFLFWISALSMKIFGINHFAYRLPSFLFAMVALASTYRLAGLFYNQRTAVFAALILASCQGFILMNHDVRTDTILMGAVIFAVWQLAEWHQNKRFIHLVAASTGIAIGMMTKGPIALMIPAFAFGTHFILRRNFKAIFKWQYLLMLVFISMLLLPMCIGLYQQFDCHPELTVNGERGVSGLKFFFWTQSFGRITGASAWNNGANIFFLLQNMLWSFLPWILFFLCALTIKTKSIFKQKLRINDSQEAITFGGFVLTYVSLGMSKYQLPHYIFVAFPFAAVITADFIARLTEESALKSWMQRLHHFHLVLFVILLLVSGALVIWPFEDVHPIMKIFALTGVAGTSFYFFSIRNQKNFILKSGLAVAVVVNFFLNGCFYPSLFRYQAGSNAGQWMRKNDIDPNRTFTFQYTIWRSLHFYAQGLVTAKDDVNAIREGDYILTQEDKLPMLKAADIRFSVLYSGPDYPISKLSLRFLNPGSRSDAMNHFYLIKIKPK